VVFKKGSFSRALRATMSIPGVFEPVPFEDKLLVDGGLLNNLPVDLVKEMGAELIIAVDLGYPTAKPEEVTSLVGVINRSLDVMMQANVSRNAKLADVVLRPSLTGYTTFSFGSAKEIIEQGYKEAERQSPSIIRFALDQSDWQDYLRSRQS